MYISNSDLENRKGRHGNEILNLITKHLEFTNSIENEIEQEVEKSSYKLTDEQLEEAGRNVWNKLQKKIQTLE